MSDEEALAVYALKIMELEAKLEVTQKKYDYVQEEGSRLIGERDDLRAKLAEVEKKYEALVPERDQARAEAFCWKDRDEQAESALSAKTEECAGLKAKLAEVEKALAALRAEGKEKI